MTTRDPVCGMNVEEEDAAATSDFQGRTYYFCSSTCKQEFDEHPSSYVQTD